MVVQSVIRAVSVAACVAVAMRHGCVQCFLFIVMLVVFYEFWYHILNRTVDDIVGNGVDRCVRVAVDGYDYA